MLKKVQMRGGARQPHARRTLVREVRGHVWAPQTKVRPSDNLARYVARRPRAPYLRRWALIVALAVSSEQVASDEGEENAGDGGGAAEAPQPRHHHAGLAEHGRRDE